jgi:bifunctional UDP-N-acetylglucosamine pyrophosphorylase/glucosamine-1-phosphate N-acetyltransferase
VSRAAIILAAGKGVRMRSEAPKVLSELGGRPLLAWVLDAVRAAGIERIVTVIGYRHADVRARFSEARDVAWVVQEPQLGTGHAVQVTEPALGGFEGEVLVLVGDAPLIGAATLEGLAERQRTTRAACTFLTTHVPSPKGYGRVVRGADGRVTAIVEEKDATEAERRIDEISTSHYCFAAGTLYPAVRQLTNDNAQREFLLTDCVAHLLAAGRVVETVTAEDYREVVGINSPEQLAEAEQLMVDLGRGTARRA